MKKKIAILGSTGSIGKSLLDIIYPKEFEIIFLVAQKIINYYLNKQQNLM
jgi:1-deoxy-D-xylulose 5-phosphate reductoisomerase